MRIQCAIFTIAIVLGGNACHAAPAMWSPVTQPAVQTSEQGFFSKIWFGDRSQGPSAPPTPTAIRPQPAPSRTAQVWNAIKSPFSSDSPKPAPNDVLSLTNPIGGISCKALVVKAQVCELRQDIAGARQNLGLALAKNPNDPATLREIGHFEDRQERLDVAEQMYRRAAAVEPRNAGLLNDLALCCARQSKFEEAAAQLAGAIRLRPEKTLYRNNIAKVLVKMEQTDAALRHLAAAHPPAIAQYNLGHLLEQNGDASAAAKCFQQAIDIDPQMSVAQTALARLKPSKAVQVAAAPQAKQVDPSPAPMHESAGNPPSEPWTADTPVASEYSPLLLPPVRE